MKVGGAGQANIDQVLAQMRALRSQTQGELEALRAQPDRALAPLNSATETAPNSFKSQLSQALYTVNSLQHEAGAASNAVASGESRDLVGAVIKGEKSGLAFQAALQVRNRMVSAYQDIFNMPI